MADKQENLPFQPYDATLGDILRTKYLRKVSIWLLGASPDAVLAMAGGSAWESALTVRFLSEFSEVLDEAGEDARLRTVIEEKCLITARWLLEQHVEVAPGLASWENVTWDTCVAVRALATVLDQYPSAFPTEEQNEIRRVIVHATAWLANRFACWETAVKYPWGPADVAQIVIALLDLRRKFPDLYEDAVANEDVQSESLEGDIVQYLLHCKTERMVSIETLDGSEDVIAVWWDDYFSTAEVVEALATFHSVAESGTTPYSRQLLLEVRTALIRACSYFEQGQLDGMWGSHIDTIKVVYSYVLIRRLIPQRASNVAEPLIVPEMHTTFKALRWLCDEKQIFDDGSFMHTMFLTIFYALALLEVYRSWEPVGSTVEQLYDDVVWFSPVRTTPERTHRLRAELENAELRVQLDLRTHDLDQRATEAAHARQTLSQALLTLFVAAIALVALVASAHATKILKWQLDLAANSNFFEVAALLLTVTLAAVALIWKWDDVVRKRTKPD